MNHWLLKSEPESFAIEDLEAAPKQTTTWDGVRNYQARNMLRDTMTKGDLAFFYHSSCAVPGIVGIVRIVRGGYPDRREPSWSVIDVKLQRKFARIVTLDSMREHAAGALANLPLLRRGNRLSVMPVTKPHWDFILDLQ